MTKLVAVADRSGENWFGEELEHSLIMTVRPMASLSDTQAKDCFEHASPTEIASSIQTIKSKATWATPLISSKICKFVCGVFFFWFLRSGA